MADVRSLKFNKPRAIRGRPKAAAVPVEENLSPELRRLRQRLEEYRASRDELLDRVDDPDMRAAILAGGH
jgi:hypothetical protein